eukprot:COSAG02_NODE_961_length_15629_cov_2.747650_6_plen_37_part_00
MDEVETGQVDEVEVEVTNSKLIATKLVKLAAGSVRL